METPFGPCHHTHYEGGPPCVHTAYLMGVEDGRVLPEGAVAEIACRVCDWDFGYENDIGDLLPAWQWHLTDKRHLQAVQEEAEQSVS
jgi:hypothetical protein